MERRPSRIEEERSVGMLTVASTVGLVAGGDALLLCLHWYTREEDMCGTVPENQIIQSLPHPK